MERPLRTRAHDVPVDYPSVWCWISGIEYSQLLQIHNYEVKSGTVDGFDGVLYRQISIASSEELDMEHAS
jgi:hypothetical protein